MKILTKIKPINKELMDLIGIFNDVITCILLLINW